MYCLGLSVSDFRVEKKDLQESLSGPVISGQKLLLAVHAQKTGPPIKETTNAAHSIGHRMLRFAVIFLPSFFMAICTF